MIDPQAILKQVRQGDIPDNWRVLHFTGFSRGLFIKIYVAYVLLILFAIMFVGLLFDLLFGDPLFSEIFFINCLIYIVGGLLAACLRCWQLGRASLVIVPDGLIHVADNRYLESHLPLSAQEGRRGRDDYRAKAIYALSGHDSALYPYKTLSFADVVSMQLKVSYLRGAWLELQSSSGERKKWLIDEYQGSPAAETAQHIIVAHTQYTARHL